MHDTTPLPLQLRAKTAARQGRYPYLETIYPAPVMQAKIDSAWLPRNHAAMDFEDATPRQRLGDLVNALSKEDLDPLSVAELDARMAALAAEIERTRAKRDKAVNHKASAEALFRK